MISCIVHWNRKCVSLRFNLICEYIIEIRKVVITLKLNSVELLYIDVDGTLASSDKNISNENKAVLKKVHEKGIHAVIASGKSIIS